MSRKPKAAVYPQTGLWVGVLAGAVVGAMLTLLVRGNGDLMSFQAPATLCERGQTRRFRPECARALADARVPWVDPNPWVLQRGDPPPDMLTDEEWAQSVEMKGCCPTSTGGIGLDHTLRQMFGPNKKQGVYIESGANDGETQSNTVLLHERRGWGGLLVEPMPSTFASLQKRRCDRSKRDVCERVALVSWGNDAKHIRLSDNNLMAKHVEEGGVEVLTTRLSDIIDAKLGRHPSIDLWSLDIEGFELEALDGVDWNRHRPAFILIETAEISRVRSKMEAVGYELMRNIVATGDPDSVSGWTHVAGHDYLFRDSYAPKDVPRVPSPQNPVHQPVPL